MQVNIGRLIVGVCTAIAVCAVVSAVLGGTFGGFERALIIFQELKEDRERLQLRVDILTAEKQALIASKSQHCLAVAEGK